MQCIAIRKQEENCLAGKNGKVRSNSSWESSYLAEIRNLE